VLYRCCGAGGALEVTACWMGSVNCDTHMFQIDELEGSDD
jgi:hypothetical protein